MPSCWHAEDIIEDGPNHESAQLFDESGISAMDLVLLCASCMLRSEIIGKFDNYF